VDRLDVEGFLESRQPLLGHLDSSVVQFMFQDDMAMLVVATVLASFDPVFKVAVDSIPG
jgi:hypothetical protein